MQMDEDPWTLWLYATDFSGMLWWHWPAWLCLAQLLYSLYFAYINRNLHSLLAERVASNSNAWQLLGTSFVLGMYCIVPIVLWFCNEWRYMEIMLYCWLAHSFIIFCFKGVFAAHLECVEWEMAFYAWPLQWWPDRDQTRSNKVYYILRDNRPPQQVDCMDYLELLGWYPKLSKNLQEKQKNLQREITNTGTTSLSVTELLVTTINNIQAARTTAHTFPFVFRSAVFGRVSVVLVVLLVYCVRSFGLWLSVPSEKHVKMQIKAQNAAKMKEVLRGFHDGKARQAALRLLFVH